MVQAVNHYIRWPDGRILAIQEQADKSLHADWLAKDMELRPLSEMGNEVVSRVVRVLLAQERQAKECAAEWERLADLATQ